jgi:hypothetical protein
MLKFCIWTYPEAPILTPPCLNSVLNQFWNVVIIWCTTGIPWMVETPLLSSCFTYAQFCYNSLSFPSIEAKGSLQYASNSLLFVFSEALRYLHPTSPLKWQRWMFFMTYSNMHNHCIMMISKCNYLTINQRWQSTSSVAICYHLSVATSSVPSSHQPPPLHSRIQIKCTLHCMHYNTSINQNIFIIQSHQHQTPPIALSPTST